MRRVLALAPELGTLRHTEAVLFVDDDKPQPQELHRILYHGVCTDENLHRAVGDTLQHLAPFLSFDDAREQLHTNGHVAKKVTDGGEMLFGKNLRRSHDAGLIAVVEGDEHRHQGHERLS